MTEEDEGIRIRSDVSKLRPVGGQDLPYPGFPTDMVAHYGAHGHGLGGESTMIETVFENRLASRGNASDGAFHFRCTLISCVTQLRSGAVKQSSGSQLSVNRSSGQ